MTPLLKVGTGVLTIGTIAGVSYAGSTYFMNKEETQNPEEPKPTIRQLIEKDFDYILLNTETTGTDDSVHWKTNWKNYKSANDDILKLEGWATKEADADLTDKLKAKCKELSTSTNITIRENVAKYCGREVTIADVVTKENLKVVNTSDTNVDQNIWKTRESKKTELQTQLTKLGATDPDLDATKIKQKCNDAKAKKKTDTDYSDFYDAYLKVCVKQEQET